jgi:hypothetical protein
MRLKVANLIIGYFFLGLACLGCLAIASHLLNLDIFNHNGYYLIFHPSNESGVDSAPFSMALVAAVGAYLVKK